MSVLRHLLSPVSSLEAFQKRSIFFTRAPEPKLRYFNTQKETQNSGKSPLILMIEWAGAAPNHIEKYTKIYTDRGFNVVSIAPPLFHFDCPNDSVGRKIVPFLEKNTDKPIVIHSFSMNGVRGIVSLAKATGNPRLMENLEGVIFDSGPSVTFSHQNGKAMMLSRPSVGYMSDENRAKTFKLLNDARDFMISPLLKLSPSARHHFSTYWYIHDKIRLPARQLYLYSDGDSMVPVDPLMTFMETQKKRGCHVDCVNFGDSEHVAHFRADPEEYKRKCIDFLGGV